MCVMDDNTDDFNMPSPLVTGSFPKMHKKQGVAAWSRFVGRLSGHSPIATQVPTPMLAVAQLLADNPANIVPPPNAISSSNFNTIFNFPFYSSTPQGTGVTPPTTPLPYSVSLVTTPTSQSLQPPSGNQINTSMSESTKDREDSTVNVPYDWALSIIDGLTADSSLDVRQTVASSLHEVTGIAARQHLLTCTLCMGSPQQNPSDNGRVGPSNNNDSPGPKGSSHISIATALMGVAGSSNQLHRGAGGQQQQVPEICGVFGSNTAATLASHSPAQNTLNILLRLLDDSDFVIANSAMKRIGEICSDIAIVGSGSGVAVSLLDGQPVLGSMRERRQFLQPVLARLQKQEKQTYGASWRKLEEVHKKLASLWLPSGFSSAFSSANCAASGHAALVNPEIAAGSFTLQRGVSLYSLASPQSDPSRHHSYEMLHDPTAINNTTFGNDGTTKGGQPPSQSRDSLCSRLYLSQLNRVVVSNCLPEPRRNQEANLPRTSFSNFSVMTGASAAQAPTLAGASMNNVNAPISNKMPSMAAMTNTSRPVFARDKDKDKDPDAVKGTRERTVNIIGGNLPEKNAADREPGSPGLRREHSFGQSTMSTFQLSLPPGTFIKVERRQGAVANSLANTRLSLSVGSMGPPSTSTFGARVSSTYHYPGGSTPSSSGGLNQNSPLQGNTLEYTLNSCLNLAMALQSLTPFAFLEYLYDSSRMSITRLRPHRDTERLQQFSQSSGLTSLVPSITAGGFAVSLAEHVLHHAPLIPAVLPIKQNIFSLPMLSAMEAFDSLSIGSFLHQTLNGAAQGKAFWASLFVAVLRRASVEGGSIAMIISEAQNANFSGFSSQQSPLAMLLNRRDVSGTAANAMSSSVNGPLSKSINKSVGPKSRRSQVGGDPSSEHYHTRDTAPSQVAVLASNGINHMSENINVFIVTYLLNEWLSMAPFDSGLNPQAPKYRGPSIIQGAGAIASSNSITGISGTVTNATAGRHKITAGSMISTPSSANNTAKRRVAFVFIAAEISKLDPKGFAACCGAKFLSMNFNQDTSIAVRRTLVASIEAFHATDLAIPLLTSFLEDPDPRLQLEAKGKLSFYIDVGELIATNPNDNDNKTINDGASEMFVGGAGLDLDGGFPAHETPIIIVPGAESSAAAGNSPMRSAADSSTVGNPIGMTLAQVDATLTNSNNNLLSANRTSGKNPSSPTSKTDATDDSFYRHALLKSCGSGRMIGLGAAKRSFRSKEQLAAESKAENKSQGNLGGSSFYDNVNSVVLGGSSNLLSVGGITSGSLAGGVKSNHTNPFLAPSATSGEGSNVPNKAALGKAGFLDGSLNSAHEEGPPTASAVSSHKNATNAQSGAKRQSNVSLIGAPTVLPTDKLPLTTTANNTSSSNENSKSGKDAVVKVGEDGHRAGAAKPTIAAHQQLAQNSNNNSNSNPNDFFDSMPAVVDITRGPVSLPIGSSIMSVIDNAFLENPTDTAVAFGGFGSILSSQLQRLFLRNAN
eukprot:GILI01006536.1.p1 GENE.GILI01006536.1~~GILI01006536.1.p1  ORF type:complete len:1684 (+),score=361.31 GILI01006536.1:598-5052(+)